MWVMLWASYKHSRANINGDQEINLKLFFSHIYLLVWKIYQFPAWKAFHFGNLLRQISLLGKLDLGTEACDE